MVLDQDPRFGNRIPIPLSHLIFMNIKSQADALDYFMVFINFIKAYPIL